MTGLFSRRAAVLLMLLAVLFAGVAAACEQGTYQGGGDSVPHYRR